LDSFSGTFRHCSKLCCALTTYGSEDVPTFFRNGQIIDLAGMERVLTLRTFNHTPLAAEYSPRYSDVDAIDPVS
jgi:hypothetical protein